MGQERQDGAQRVLGSSGTAGEVEHQSSMRMGCPRRDLRRRIDRRIEDAADAAAEGGVGCVARSLLADEFGQAWDQPGTDGEGGLRGDVARAQPGAASGEHQRGPGGGLTQGGDELGKVIGEGERIHQPGAGRSEDLRDGRAGEVCLSAGEATVADREDHCGAAGKGGGEGHMERIEEGIAQR